MSDKERRESRSPSSESEGSKEKKSVKRSPKSDHSAESRSPSRTPSRSRSGSHYKSKSRSHSRSRSRSHKRRRRSRSKSREYHKHSRSRSRSPYYKRRRSRSRSRGRSPRYDRYDHRDRYSNYRSRSRSPMSSRRRHMGDRDDPEPSKCLGVFGLSLYTEERELHDVFSRFGSLDTVQIVYDRQSGRSRGFAFVYFHSVDDAIEAKDRCNGSEIDGRRIRVDYSITHRAHTPTPGIYLGKPTSGFSRKRSSSPNHEGTKRSSKYSRSRSRSRSYSSRK